MATRVNFDNATRKLQALGNVLHRPIRDVLDSGARVAAISLAKSTQPDGTGAEAKEQGEKAVERDIRSVYGTPGNAWESISNKFAKAIFWKAYKNGDIDVAQQTLWDWSSRYRGVLMEKFDGGRKHKALRRKTRPVIFHERGRQAVIVTNPEELAHYIEHVKSNVGTAKGGWVDVVRAIGSNNSGRGLRQEGDITANWITRRAHGFGAAHRGGTDSNPTITITNRVPYIDQMLSNSARNYALKVAHDRMIENLETAVRHEAKNLREAA